MYVFARCLLYVGSIRTYGPPPVGTDECTAPLLQTKKSRRQKSSGVREEETTIITTAKGAPKSRLAKAGIRPLLFEQTWTQYLLKYDKKYEENLPVYVERGMLK